MPVAKLDEETHEAAKEKPGSMAEAIADWREKAEMLEGLAMLVQEPGPEGVATLHRFSRAGHDIAPACGKGDDDVGQVVPIEGVRRAGVPHTLCGVCFNE